MTFGRQLRSLRIRRHWTQQQLADAIGKSKNNISQYELGKREPSLRQLVQLSQVLEVTVDELLGAYRQPFA